MDFRQTVSLSTTDQLSDTSSRKHNLDGAAHLPHLLTVSFLLLVHSSYLLSDVSLLLMQGDVYLLLLAGVCAVTLTCRHKCPVLPWGGFSWCSSSSVITLVHSLPRSLYFSQRFITVEGLTFQHAAICRLLNFPSFLKKIACHLVPSLKRLPPIFLVFLWRPIIRSLIFAWLRLPRHVYLYINNNTL